MKKTVAEILKESIGELVSEETLTQLNQLFESKVDDTVSLHVEKALMEQDEEYSKKLDAFAAAVDEDRTKKMKLALEKLDADRTAKLKLVAEKYKKAINEEAIQLREELIAQVSNYLDLYLEEAIPTEKLNEAVKNTKAVKVLGDLRTVLAVDKAVMTESVREGLLDAKAQITESSSKIETLVTENDKLSKELNAIKKEKLLAEKSADLPVDQKTYMLSMLESKDIDFIEKNWDYTLEMFDRSEEDRLDALRSQAADDTKSKKVDRIVSESVEKEETQVNESVTSEYLNELGRY